METKNDIQIITSLLFCLVLLLSGCRSSRSSVGQHTTIHTRLVTADSMASQAAASWVSSAIDSIIFTGFDSLRIFETAVTDTTGRTVRTRTIERVATASSQQSSVVRSLSDSTAQTTKTAQAEQTEQTDRQTSHTKQTQTETPWRILVILIIINLTIILWPHKT